MMTDKNGIPIEKLHIDIQKAPAPRELTHEELEKLAKDKNPLSDFKRNKYELEAQKNWDKFYKRNTTKFFKDRHWTTREFEDLCGNAETSGDAEVTTLLEVGCGVGNFIWPLLSEKKNFYFYACDFSPRAVQFVKENALYREDCCKAFQCDLVKDNLNDNVPADSVDIVTMIFVLSAIHPDKMPQALTNILKVLRPGGCVLFRDYGLYDHAMLRFAPGHKLEENFYVRQDGTRAFYFSLDFLKEMFTEAGFNCENIEYVFRETVNRKEGLCVPRIFLQAKFTKPLIAVEGHGKIDGASVSHMQCHESQKHEHVENNCNTDPVTSLDKEHYSINEINETKTDLQPSHAKIGT
ncbi:unnamed protein product [Owenia fusiformis]|uniref:tRNA N(3)-cytidine methyltransferase METTL6 n=1 Tax=Owenia fusiformis TaxID=6347 RepID=A0A8J1UKX6_OWEFU|nr:unnamed protein product [Owenia fusiformis]